MRLRLSLNCVLVVAALLAAPLAARAGDPPGTGARPVDAALPGGDPRVNARALVSCVDSVASALDRNDAALARARWMAFRERWLEVEDPIRALDPASYRAIESAMADVTAALPAVGPLPLEDARAGLAAVRAGCLVVAASPRGTVVAVETKGSVSGLLGDAARGCERCRAGDVAGGLAALERATEQWYAVEHRVNVKSKTAYSTCEGALAEARSALRRSETEKAAAAFDRLSATLEPFSATEQRYGVLDAAAILLREGAEALLVLAAVASFLGRIGARDKVRLVWIGGALGVVASLAAGALLVRIFTAVTAGARQELVEGFSSLVTAVLLVLVGHWLHEKIRRGGWKSDVEDAVARGGSVSIALVAFFAVFREGAETVIFYAGIAQETTPRELALGVGLGFLALALLAVVVLGLGKRMPIGPFLTFATVLLWALAVKFVGNGVHALQTGGVLPATGFWTGCSIPEVPAIGFAPTFETTAAQLAAVLVWVGFELGPRLARRRKLAALAVKPVAPSSSLPELRS
jgi:high-affinity iron transporter